METLTANFTISGETGKLAQNIADNWLIGLRQTNPAILDMFYERDKNPYRELLPWSGEFAGKYITGAFYIYRLTGDERLKNYILSFIDELCSCVDGGYIGCYSKECRLTGATSIEPEKIGATWDSWSHYHIMTGLYLWYKETGNQKYIETVKEIAQLFLSLFYNGPKRLADIGSTEMNFSVIHIFALLYEETGEDVYLNFAKEIEKDLELPDAGDYVRNALQEVEFYLSPKPRWESLHIIMGIAELYNCTHEQKYFDAATQIFYSILKTDIHNTGGFSTEEQAIGNPFVNGNIELCCVVAYNVLASIILKMANDSKIADHLELSHYNAVMGSFSQTGRWSTYNTPMEGTKCANYHSIGFQCRPGSPELNCCSVNAPRGIGILSEWAFMKQEDTLYVNYYEACSVHDESGLHIEISGDYPAAPEVSVKIGTSEFRRLGLRIPSWSVQTVVTINGVRYTPAAGEYFFIEENWINSEIKIRFDFSTRLFAGEGAYNGFYSVYVGPVLYGYDLSLNSSMENIPELKRSELELAAPERQKNGRILLKTTPCILSDFYTLGQSGSEYKTWFVVK